MRSPARTRLVALASIALTSALGARTARADEQRRPIRAALEVDDKTSCVDAASMAKQLEHWLGRGEIDARLSISVRAPSLEAPSYVVRREGKATGERTLHLKGATCDEVKVALGLAIAVALDATLLESLGVIPPQPPPAPAPTSASPAPPSWPPPTSPQGPDSSLPLPPSAPLGPSQYSDSIAGAPPPAPELEVAKPVTAPGLSLAVEGVVLVGVLPDVALGVVPDLSLELGKHFDARFSALITSRVEVDVGSGKANVSLASGRADLCAKLKAPRTRLRGCAGVSAGAMQAEGVGFRSAYSTVTPWVAPALRFDARWGFGRFGLGVSVDGYLPGLKPRLDTVDGAGNVTASRTLALGGITVGVGPSFTFW